METRRTILVETGDGLTRVTLNRPERRNAFDRVMLEELRDCIVGSGSDPSIRGIILTGTGSVFCAGADLHWMGSEVVSVWEARRDAALLLDLLRAIDECPCPVIGRIQGSAYGGGLGLIAACDIVVARTDVTFSFGEVRVGLVPAVIAPFLLRKAGDSFLRRYSLTGESFSASVAKGAGLVHDVVEPAVLDHRVNEVAGFLTQLAPLAVRETKRLLRQLRDLPEAEQWKMAVEANVRARMSAEAQEGLRAFREKRNPTWSQAGPQ
ncbi:MAG: enoyl-CoA hydratase-related protein [Nitrospira sp.]|nr:enoyl-CoA hydratase-related protein [Nitrospira sp.]MCP9442003.1 enoyl-CoA hydratase-related protein [Nitrospira sp.]